MSSAARFRSTPFHLSPKAPSSSSSQYHSTSVKHRSLPQVPLCVVNLVHDSVLHFPGGTRCLPRRNSADEKSCFRNAKNDPPPSTQNRRTSVFVSSLCLLPSFRRHLTLSAGKVCSNTCATSSGKTRSAEGSSVRRRPASPSPISAQASNPLRPVSDLCEVGLPANSFMWSECC